MAKKCKWHDECLTCPYSDCVEEMDIKNIGIKDLEEMRIRVPYNSKEYAKVNARIYYLNNRAKVIDKSAQYFAENHEKVLKTRRRRWKKKRR